MYQEINEVSPAFASLFNAIVAPRPIGWISSVSPEGVANLAPFSYFNGISPLPAMVMFSCNGTVSSGRQKDTIENVRLVPEFVANFACWDLRQQVNTSSASVDFDIDEFELAGLERAPARRVRPPLVAAAPANLECRVVKIVDLPPQAEGEVISSLVIGRVVAVHIRDEFINSQGRFDTVKANPIVRLGGFNFATLGDLFEMSRPTLSPATRTAA